MVKPKTPRGMRDFKPQDVYFRQWVIQTLKEIFERHGFQPIETPAIELKEVLLKKYGEEERLIFSIEKEGKEDLALRYDLTVPLARFITLNPDVSFPFKRYHIGKCWRRENPKYGRYREFYQCDVDIVGCESVLADAEIISIIVEALEAFGFEEFRVRINNRKLLKAMMRYAGVLEDKVVSAITACDKLSKLGFNGVRRELMERGISQKSIEKIFKVMGIGGENFKILEKFEILIEDDSEGVEGILELRELLNYLKALGVDERFLRVDMSLARALDYYTGPIYETYVTKPKIGSLTGGGRYDELLSMFSKKKVPATGTTIGMERIIDVLKKKDFGKVKTLPRVLITYTEREMLSKACEIARDLWERQIDAELYINPLKKLRKQFEYANKRGIERVIVVGPRDLEKNQVTLREMVSGKERKLELEKLYDLLKHSLN